MVTDGDQEASGDLVENGSMEKVALTDLEEAADPAKRSTITTSRNAWVLSKPRALTPNGRLVTLNTTKSYLELQSSHKLRDNRPQTTSLRPPQCPQLPLTRELHLRLKTALSTRLLPILPP